MMIPTISIDGVSMPVTRDGTNLLSNMPLGEVASQVLEQGAAFEAAVEQFQQIMAEFTTGESVQAYAQSASSDRDNGQLARSGSAASAIDSATVTTDTPASSVPVEVAGGASAPSSPGGAQKLDLPEAVATSSTPLAEEVNATSVLSNWDNGHLARCGRADVAIDGATATDSTPASFVPSPASSAPMEVTEGVSASSFPVVAQKLDLPEAVATSSDTPVEEANAASVPSNWDNGHLARCGGAGVAIDGATATDGSSASSASVEVADGSSASSSPVVATSSDPPVEEVNTTRAPADWDNVRLVRYDAAGEATTSVHGVVSTPADVASRPTVVTLAADVTSGVESGASLVMGVDQSQVVASQVPATDSPDQPLVQVGDSLGVQAKITPAVDQDLDSPVAVDQDLDSPVAVEQELDPPVLQSAPVSVPAQMQVIDVKDVAVEPVQVVAARVAHQVVATPAQVLIEAASAVADTIVVSPGLLRGAGEVQVQLRPDVLEGTVIQISTTASGSLTVQFMPVTENMAELLEKCAPQLVTYLSERIHSVQVAVNVKRDEKLKG